MHNVDATPYKEYIFQAMQEVRSETLRSYGDGPLRQRWISDLAFVVEAITNSFCDNKNYAYVYYHTVITRMVEQQQIYNRDMIVDEVLGIITGDLDYTCPVTHTDRLMDPGVANNLLSLDDALSKWFTEIRYGYTTFIRSRELMDEYAKFYCSLSVLYEVPILNREQLDWEDILNKSLSRVSAA